MTSNEYIQSVIESRGQKCGNCGAWRLLKPEFEDARSSVEAGSLRIIEECRECGDEAFDIYEAAEDGP
jgi:DNA-directed RNA polymerase subunit RPC12/RpoP